MSLELNITSINRVIKTFRILLRFLVCDLTSVFKFVEPPENNEKHVDHKRRVKFKIVSLKVKGDMDYVPELVCCAVSNSEILDQCLYHYCLKSGIYYFNDL